MSKTKKNPYLDYSSSTLETLAQQYALMLGSGRTTIGDGKDLGEAYEQVCEALEELEDTDYCKHGNYRWTDHDIACGACEME